MAMEIDELVRASRANEAITGTAAEVIDAVLSLLGDVDLCDDAENAVLFDFEKNVARSACETTGSHEWIHDQCGCWWHKYCRRCNEAKYPGLCNKSAAEGLKLTSGATEEEYDRRADRQVV